MELKVGLGFAFIILGITWSVLDRFLCKSLCNICTYEQISPCFFLFLFVGIIFIMDGIRLIIPIKKNKFKKNLSVNFKSKL